MKKILNTLAVLLLIGWAIGYFEYHLGGFFHFILVAVLIIFIVPFLPGKNE